MNEEAKTEAVMVAHGRAEYLSGKVDPACKQMTFQLVLNIKTLHTLIILSLRLLFS